MHYDYTVIAHRGGCPLSKGGPRWLIATWVEMVRRWFEDGAPRTGGGGAQRRRVDPRGPRPRHAVQGRSEPQLLSGGRERARAAYACNRRVASWPSGLDGLSLADHAPIPCQSVPGRRQDLAQIALCSRSRTRDLTTQWSALPRGSANPTGI